MFSFKRFEVDDGRCSMKVGTDGVLLGAWFDPQAGSAQAGSAEHGISHAGSDAACRRLLDVGSGCGVIALAAALRTEDNARCTMQIDAVDMDEGCFLDARTNFRHSPWSARLTALLMPFAELVAERPAGCYDIILSNPPYYTNALLPPDGGRCVARHTMSLPFAGLAAGVARLLAPQGAFSLVLPTAEAEVFAAEAARHDLHPHRIARVSSREGAPPIRMLMELRRGRCEAREVRHEAIAIHTAAGDFSACYRTLTKDFYLKF